MITHRGDLMLSFTQDHITIKIGIQFTQDEIRQRD